MPFIRRLSVAKSKHARGLLRAGGYLAVLSLGLGAFQLRAAHAEVRNRTVELGRQMYEPRQCHAARRQQAHLNGQPLWVGSSVAKDSVTDVLDRYEADLPEEPRAADRELAGARAEDRREEGKNAAVSTGVMRAGGAATKEPSFASRRARARSRRCVKPSRASPTPASWVPSATSATSMRASRIRAAPSSSPPGPTTSSTSRHRPEGRRRGQDFAAISRVRRRRTDSCRRRSRARPSE